jgi:hypothetical protein
MKKLWSASLALLLLTCATAQAEEATAPGESAEVAAGSRKVPEPQVLQQVTEDDQVRIEELRVRGQTKKLTVQPKIKGMGAYEIAPPEPGRAPADDPKAGQRVWLSITF